jgi:hypothetical protein
MPVDLSKFDGMTPGKWSEEYLKRVLRFAWKGSGPWEEVDDDEGRVYFPTEGDAKYLVAVPDLIAEVRELRAERDRLLDERGELRGQLDGLIHGGL